MIVAVTGATGYVGRFIVKRLIEEGAAVRAWRRPSSDLRGLPDAIEWIEGDLNAPDSASALVEGAEMLVHGALEHEPGKYRQGEGGDLPHFLRANVGGSMALLAAAKAAGVRRCVFLSSRAVFGARRSGEIGDGDRVEPDTNYGAAKAALEAFVESWGRSEGWPIAALRPTGVYGMVVPAERSKWFSLVGEVLDGKAVPPRAGTEVHGDDVAAATWRLLRAPAEVIAGRMFNCSDIVVSNRDIVQLMQSIDGVSGPVPDAGTPPKGIMRTDALAALGVTFGGKPLFERTIAELVEVVRSGRAVA